VLQRLLVVKSCTMSIALWMKDDFAGHFDCEHAFSSTAN